MKKLLVFNLIFFCFFISHAQQKYGWNGGLTFTLPGDFKEVKNTSELYEANGDGMSITLRLLKDSTLTKDDIFKFTMDLAEQMDFDVMSAVESTKIKGLAGAYVTGRRQGVVHYLLAIIDPESENNFYAMVPFNDNNKDAEEEALKIIQSIKQK